MEHNRQSIRLRDFDYASPGAYFVTIVTQNRECLYGNVVEGEMVLNELGRIVDLEWQRTPFIRWNVVLDAFVVMPNHLHGILWVTDRCRGVLQYAPTGQHRFESPSQNLGAIIRGFKSVSTKSINETRNTPGTPLWQRNYHERVIRNQQELNRIRQYILDNPKNWEMDDEFVHK